ncbi:MAG: cell division protein FtsL [Gammaproteobacteria bacterium]|nr:cell division protein FtsL [Gammaproteobacteria bacterium]NND59561.1 cell division protein FtsL [Gammaproteobacteria bacterium]
MSRGLYLGLTTVILAAAVLVAAIAVVDSRHQARKLFAELQQLQKERDELDIDWGRLRLEQSTYATYGLIETTAREELQMKVPSPEEIVIVQQP